MKMSVWCAVLSSIVVLLGGCKPMHERDGLDPVSNPDFVRSDGGTMLTASRGKEFGICMLQSSLRDPKNANLVTERGAISHKQLKSALRFMGYGEHVAILLGSVAIAAVGGIVAPTAAIAIGLTTLAGGTLGYRIVKGNVEGEKAGPITVHALSAAALQIASPLVEYIHREGRLEKVLSDREELRFTDRRMRKLIEKLGSIYPDYPNQCDHLKADLQRH